MAYSAAISPGGPFPSFDTLRHGAQSQFIDVKDIFSAAQVCKAWNQVMKNDNLWLSLMQAKGFPPVEGITENFKPVVLKLSRIEIICPTIGESRENLILSNKAYKMLDKNDRFIPADQPQKTILKTGEWQLVKLPDYEYLPYDEELFTKLNGEDAKDEDIPEICADSEMKIPRTLRNCELLIKHFYPNQNVVGFIHSEVRAQCNKPPGPRLYLVRKVPVYFGQAYPEQKWQIEGKGCKLVPILVGFATSITDILKARTLAPYVYARTASTIRIEDEDKNYSVSIGFAPGVGVHLYGYYYDFAYDYIGALPGVPAEARPSDIGSRKRKRPWE
jgi:hypothetical protein